MCSKYLRKICISTVLSLSGALPEGVGRGRKWRVALHSELEDTRRVGLEGGLGPPGVRSGPGDLFLWQNCVHMGRNRSVSIGARILYFNVEIVFFLMRKSTNSCCFCFCVRWVLLVHVSRLVLQLWRMQLRKRKKSGWARSWCCDESNPTLSCR